MFRIYIERKTGFENEAIRIKSEITGFLGIAGVTAVRYLNRYDVENVTDDVVQAAANRIFSEPQSDTYSFSAPQISDNETVIIWEYLPGQYDQRSDSAEQCISLLRAEMASSVKEGAEPPKVRCAKMVILTGTISVTDTEKIKNYLINPVDSQLTTDKIPETLKVQVETPSDIPVQTGFISYNQEQLSQYHQKMGLAMDFADIAFLQDYFKKINRDPTETEIKVLDTYWSDHCRHTTFNTHLDNIEIENGPLSAVIKESYEEYKIMRTDMYAERAEKGKTGYKPVTLMDMACIGAKYLKKAGKLDDIEISEEINACSIYIDVHYTENKLGPETERWLLMFKNETHNHPTEIEPFGGAATCIGGAIRDPLSGRSWVYQALRVTGAADPTVPLSKTLPGKLPQMKLTREAAAGFSAYGNQIGLTTGQVAEIYHPGFEAKRMELGAVIAAAPADIVMREEPEAGDCIVLVGGGTGRDGIGGATGSSKVHTEKSVTTAAAEVQKGNAVEERKIQRLFRNPDVSKIIRRCNDFGAGGVAVAVGELAPGLEIDLDAVPKKYEGLNGTELAISESQERMAIVVRSKDVDTLIAAANAENLNAAVIARVTNTNRLVMNWRGKTIVDIERSFLDTAGATRSTKAIITSPNKEDSPLCKPLDSVATSLSAENSLEKAWKANLTDLAVCSQRGLSERFDGSIGSSTVLFPMGGTYQNTPESGCAAKIPVLFPRETTTASLMTFGYDPRVAQWSPWHGAQNAVIQSLSKVLAMGGDPETCRLTFQEYFERTTSSEAWGKPVAALLGALSAQKKMGTASIGGKDSMSGSYQDLKVPPTLVSFAVTTTDAQRIVSGDMKKAGSNVYAIVTPILASLAPDFDSFITNSKALQKAFDNNEILSAYAVGAGGLSEALTKMCFGNMIGLDIDNTVTDKISAICTEQKKASKDFNTDCWFLPMYGTVIVETDATLDNMPNIVFLGKTKKDPVISFNKMTIDLKEGLSIWEKPLSKVFPPISGKETPASYPEFATKVHPSVEEKRKSFVKTSYTIKPKVLIPVFPGTNCEFDMARAFAISGADAKIFVFRNNTPEALAQSLEELAKELSTSQILALAGGFSAGDEPDGSGKFIANVLREHRIADNVMSLLQKRDGLVLGICNGFQALIKVGLVPYGIIREPSEEMPTLTYNTIGRHISRICRTRLTSAATPWAYDETVLADGTQLIPLSHGEGRVILSNQIAEELFNKGQVFSQYTDEFGNPALTEPDNPNGSAFAIEGLLSPDGKVLGKMGHSERTITGMSKNSLIKNVEGNNCQNIFAAGVRYFK
jgi:phosphoribosylformylglycinamidine synthase